MAREIQRVSSNGQDTDLDHLQERLGKGLSRKDIADCASKLHRLGYSQRLGFSKYRATDKLSQLAGGTEAEEPAGQAEDAGKPAAVIFRKQSREQAERAAKKRQEAELVRLGKMLDRLEVGLDKLENVPRGFGGAFQNQTVLEQKVYFTIRNQKPSRSMMFTVSLVSISGFVACAGFCSLDKARLLAKVCRPPGCLRPAAGSECAIKAGCGGSRCL